jgi:hypothetical protein
MSAPATGLNVINGVNKMKIELKIIGPNTFAAYHITSSDRINIGTYKGAVATVKRLIAKDKSIPVSEITIERSIFKGWY